jgi:hypothetical protein
VTTSNGRSLTAPELEGAVWTKSSYSGGDQGQCVEVANVICTHKGIAVRDSKNPTGPALLITPEAFDSFVAAAQRGEFND